MILWRLLVEGCYSLMQLNGSGTRLLCFSVPRIRTPIGQRCSCFRRFVRDLEHGVKHDMDTAAKRHSYSGIHVSSSNLLMKEIAI